MDLHYNAFISYRHHPQDIKVAETIHRALERYKVPKALKQQGKSIERIFRDKEELPITSSLTDNISMALRNSDYQIVICSTHLKDSYWVQREIETFLQTHTKDKVLTVLVDGDNPYDVIPEILTYNEVVDPVTGEVTREPIEPLSCDWRMPKRKAMREELPRLAAVLLGCAYDDLIQRQKQYRQRRLLAGISTGMAASLALAGYFLYTSIQIQENLDQSLRNQSQYLASTSQELFNKGDRLKALALALEALPQDGNRPYVPAAEQALTDALMLYEATGQLISVASFDAESTVENFAVSDDGKTIYILDNQYNVSAWDTTEYQKLSTFNITKFQVLNSTLLTDSHSNLLTLGGVEGKTLLCFNRDGKQLWQMDSIEDIAMTADKNTVLAIRSVPSSESYLNDSFELLYINTETGELTAEPFTAFTRSTGYAPSFATETCYEGLPVAINCYVDSESQCVLVVNPETKTCRKVLTHSGFFSAATITEDGRLYVMVSENDEMSNGRVATYYFYTQSGAWLYCYNLNSGSQLWRTYFTTYNYSEADSILPISGTDTLFCQYGSAFMQVDAKNGKILQECHSTAIPLALQMREGSVWVLFTNGCAGSYTFDNNTIGYIQYMENGLLQGHNNKGIYVLPQLSSNVLLYRTTSDDSYTVFSGEYDDFIDEMELHGNLMATVGMSNLNMFDVSAKQLLWKQDIGYSNYPLGFSSDGSKLYTRKNSNIYQFDTATGESVEWALPLKSETTDYYMYYDSIGYGSDTVCSMIFSYEDYIPRILFFDCNTQEYVISEFPTEEDYTQWRSYGNYPMIVHVTDTCALIRTAAGSLYRFDRTTQEASVITDNVSNSPVFLDEAENDRMIFATGDGILFTDAAGQPTLEIPLADYFAVSFFRYEDLLLCLGSDGGIHRFDLEGNELGLTATSIFSNYFVQTNNIHSQNVPITWAVTPDNEIVVNIFRMGNIINTEHWERTCDIQQLVFYHADSDTLIAQSDGMIYSYKRCTLDELMAQAKDALGSFKLTDDQREYYGLNETT